MSQAHTTTDHDTIRQWVEAREGKPSTVRATIDEDDDAGILRIDFPGGAGEEALEEISWETFFEKFDEEGLQFLYQDKIDGNKKSHFCKFVRKAK